MRRVTSKWQVTIPEEIREGLGIRPGDEVVFEATDGGIIISKQVSENRLEKWRCVADTDQNVEERMEELRGRRG